MPVIGHHLGQDDETIFSFDDEENSNLSLEDREARLLLWMLVLLKAPTASSAFETVEPALTASSAAAETAVSPTHAASASDVTFAESATSASSANLSSASQMLFLW